MLARSVSLSLVALALMLVGCGSDGGSNTPRPDGGAPDSGATDGAQTLDTTEDAWVWPDPDTGVPLPDQGLPDQGTPPLADQGQPADQGTPPVDTTPPPDTAPPPDTGPTPDTGTPTPDTGTVDSAVDSGPPVKCASTGVVLQEIAVGFPDYVALRNTASAPISVVGYTVEMYGIGSTPEIYTITAADVSGDLGAGEWLYVVENSEGAAGEISTGDNIPFYNGPPNATKPNSALLYDPLSNLVDYFAVGDSLGKPQNVAFAPLGWPATFDADVVSFQRKANTGNCPTFAPSDWGTAGLSRRP